MIDVYILDAHSLIWHLVSDKKLGSKAALILKDSNSRLVLPAVALAEAMHVVHKGRTKIPNVETLVKDILADSRITIEPLTLEILLESQNALAVPEMHDRLITATALNYAKRGFNVAVVTKDETIVAANLAEIVWN